jgi:hypothetical protein
MPMPLRAFAQQGHHGHFQGRASDLRPFDHLRQPDELWWSILPWICRWTVVRFFSCSRTVRMDLHEGAVQADKFDLDPKDPLFLKGRKDFCQNPIPSPPAHPGVDRMPTTEVLGKAPSLTAVLGHVQDGVENLEVGKADVAALSGQAVFDLAVLRFCDFHWWSIA